MGSNLRGPNNVIIEEHKLCYMAIPKVATTSIKRKLGEISTAGQASKLQYASKEEIKESEYFCFALTRHPFTRAVSGWLNKFHNEVEILPVQRYSPYGFYDRMSFQEFVHIICSVPDPEMDVHFQSQTHCLVLDGAKVPHFTGKIENFTDDWAHIAHAVKGCCGVDIKDIGHFRPSAAAERAEGVLTPYLKDMLYERYSEDFRHFGYLPDQF